MRKVLIIVLFFISILNSKNLESLTNEIKIVKNKIYLIKKEDTIKALTKDTIINVLNYKNKRVVTLLSGSAKLIIKD